MTHEIVMEVRNLSDQILMAHENVFMATKGHYRDMNPNKI